MITQPNISEETVVFENIGPQFLNPRLVFKVNVTFKQPTIEFNDLPKGKVLAGSFVETADGLNQLGNTVNISDKPIKNRSQCLPLRCHNQVHESLRS